MMLELELHIGAGNSRCELLLCLIPVLLWSLDVNINGKNGTLS
jgi:hypothetical protein